MSDECKGKYTRGCFGLFDGVKIPRESPFQVRVGLCVPLVSGYISGVVWCGRTLYSF